MIMYRLCCSFLFFFGLARGFSPIVKTRTNLAPATSSSALSMGIKDAIVGRFRKKKEIEVVPIMVGQSLPGRCEIAFVIARHFANLVCEIRCRCTEDSFRRRRRRHWRRNCRSAFVGDGGSGCLDQGYCWEWQVNTRWHGKKWAR